MRPVEWARDKLSGRQEAASEFRWLLSALMVLSIWTFDLLFHAVGFPLAIFVAPARGAGMGMAGLVLIAACLRWKGRLPGHRTTVLGSGVVYFVMIAVSQHAHGLSWKLVGVSVTATAAFLALMIVWAAIWDFLTEA